MGRGQLGVLGKPKHTKTLSAKKQEKNWGGSKVKEKLLATNSYSIILISKTHKMEKENHSLASYPLIPYPLDLHTLCNYFKI